MAIHDARLRHRNAGSLGDMLGLRLVHGKRRSQHAGMRIGNFEIFEDALDRAVLAEGPMQRVEGHVGTQIRQARTPRRDRHRCG